MFLAYTCLDMIVKIAYGQRILIIPFVLCCLFIGCCLLIMATSDIGTLSPINSDYCLLPLINAIIFRLGYDDSSKDLRQRRYMDFSLHLSHLILLIQY